MTRLLSHSALAFMAFAGLVACPDNNAIPGVPSKGGVDPAGAKQSPVPGQTPGPAVGSKNPLQPEPEILGVLNVPYFYQYNNRHEPDATCGLSSVSMVINHFFSGKVTPDTLYEKVGKARAQTPEGISGIINSYGLYSKFTRSGRRATIKTHLDAKRPVIAHGNWTVSGHIIVLVGYIARGWVANDPAGNASECYDCAARGAKVVYPFGSKPDQQMSDDGDIWFTAVSKAPF